MASHPRAGEETHFSEKVLAGEKIHTCRLNYAYWKNKIDRLKAEGGVLSLRQWSGKPYRSKQETIIDIPAEIVGVQKLIVNVCDGAEFYVGENRKWIDSEILAKNDGLSEFYFLDWFMPVLRKAKSEGCQTLALIHFSIFRY